MSHSSTERGTGKIELLELNTLNEHFLYEFLMRKKHLFIWENYI